MAQEKTRILFVDDERHNLLAFKANFRREYDILIAQSAAQGKAIMARENNIDVVISDQRMPEESGVEFLEFVKVHHPNSVRLLLTAYSDTEALIAAINKARIFRYMSKPFDRNRIRTAIEEALAEQQVESLVSIATQQQDPDLEDAEINGKPREELNQLLDEYSSLWEAWVNRSALLSAKEVLALEYYRKHGDHGVLAQELGVSNSSVYSTYSKAVSKLRGNMNTLNAWIMSRALELKEQAQDGTDNTHRFLHTPLKELNLSKPLVLALSRIDCHKPDDVIMKTSVLELQTMRNFGQKKLDELQQLFEANGCGHLLQQQ